MGYLDSYITEMRKPRLGLKKIWVTDEWPEDNQFWVGTVYDSKRTREGVEVYKTIHRYDKYWKTKSGRWFKKEVLGESVEGHVFMSTMPWVEFEKINNGI
jgi:hypothetical protein